IPSMSMTAFVADSSGELAEGCLDGWVTTANSVSDDLVCDFGADAWSGWKHVLGFVHSSDQHLADPASGRGLEPIRYLDGRNAILGHTFRQWSPLAGAVLISFVQAVNEIVA